METWTAAAAGGGKRIDTSAGARAAPHWNMETRRGNQQTLCRAFPRTSADILSESADTLSRTHPCPGQADSVPSPVPSPIQHKQTRGRASCARLSRARVSCVSVSRGLVSVCAVRELFCVGARTMSAQIPSVTHQQTQTRARASSRTRHTRRHARTQLEMMDYQQVNLYCTHFYSA